MIWQFGELGYEVDINDPCRTCNKPIRWEYLQDPDRKAIYDTWAKLIRLRLQEEIFHTGNFTLDVNATTGLKKIQLTDNDNSATLKHINIIGNFGVTAQSIVPAFQQTGTWYDLLNDNSSITVNNVNAPINLQPGEFKVYASSQVALPVEDFVLNDADIHVYPNPAGNSFRINRNVQKVEIYDYTGRMVTRYEGDFFPDKEYDTSSLEPSMYFVRIHTDLGSSSKRLIVE